MTESEAIKEVRFNMSTIGLSDKAAKRVVEARNMVIKALEKQIPKKPRNKKYSFYPHSTLLKSKYGECPVCKTIQVDDEYCANCGQKLDWSDEKMKENVCITCEYYEECNKPKREIKCIGYKEKEKENE